MKTQRKGSHHGMFIKERVIENRLIGHPAQGIYKLILSGQVAKIAQPGQFVQIQVIETQDPLLRRPLSIAGINREREEITIYYKVVGRGTDLLTRVKENDYVSILGPLGTGFTIPSKGELLLIAGGIGVFPLYSLIQAIDHAMVKVHLLWGGETMNFLESAEINLLLTTGIELEISTVDGSCGHQGLVTDLLQSYLQRPEKELLKNQGLLTAASCGPRGMLKAVTEICAVHKIPLEVSLEEKMACGIGACLGCVCTVQGEDGELKRKRVCKEGPVLKAKEVIWDGGC